MSVFRITFSSRAMPEWVLLGCDSDGNGALAVIRGPFVGFEHNMEVHDCPMKEVTVNNTARLRQDVDAMARLVAGLNHQRGHRIVQNATNTIFKVFFCTRAR